MDHIQPNKINKVVSSILNKKSECHHASNNTAVCSPNYIVKKMHTYIKKNKTSPSYIKSATDVVETIKDMLNCNSESCVLNRASFIEFASGTQLNDVLDKFFKPAGPPEQFGLLSNFNIDDVLDQFEHRFNNRNFLHIPFQMRDFKRIGTMLHTMDLAKQFNDGIKTFGVVINTDYSSGGGIHWFCLYGELINDKITLDFFNSSGNPPLPEIQAWLQKTKHHLKRQLKIPVNIHYSTGIRFQSDKHSCGVYSLCYIWLRLEGVPNTWFKASNFNDAFMHKARVTLFRDVNI